MGDKSAFGGFFKVVLVIAAIYGVSKFNDLRERGDDFNACDLQSLKFADFFNRNLSVQPGVKESHDQIDDLISTCMIGKGYVYDATGWERCPSEKLAFCYRKPSLISKIESTL